MASSLWITGIVPAVFTPMRPDGELNLAMVAPIVERLIDQGASALYVCGATGEGPSLTRQERMAVTQAYVDAVARRLPVIVQVGHNSLRAARQLAEHAASIGADAISATPPHFFKIDSPETLLQCLAEISAGAPYLPLYYYHIPRLTAIHIDPPDLLRLGGERLPALRGLKYSDFTIYDLQACVELDGGRFNVLFGSDEMLLSGLIGGAQGAVGTTYNFALPLYRRIYQAFRRGDIVEAQQLQGLSVKMVRALNRHATACTNLPPMKALMKIIGLDCGPLRLPLLSLNEAQTEALQEEMKAIGLFPVLDI
ncbi:MAG: dihydrodipicolinate synthase family protein [Anaerolineales bacterium]|nr:dihydrodipicolinate synthase family protein [Anaerolineales bacterium]